MLAAPEEVSRWKVSCALRAEVESRIGRVASSDRAARDDQRRTERFTSVSPIGVMPEVRVNAEKSAWKNIRA